MEKTDHSNLNFYKDLKTFKGTAHILNDDNYVDLPNNWSVIITDIKGSTKAIEQGRYKDVNIVGVTSIISVQNSCGDTEIPFIFGGDGATLFIPNEKVEFAKKALAYSRWKAKTEFNLQLRVAILPMTVILAEKKLISIAKMNLSGTSCIAMARGNGLVLAESLTKKTDQFLIPEIIETVGSHQGLECRWNPITSQHGEIISLIIKVEENSSNDLALYQEIISKINQIVPDFQLITAKKLSTVWPPIHLFNEVKAKYAGLIKTPIYLGLAFLVFLLTLIVRLTKNNPTSAVSKYLNELSTNTDFLKFDDTLKMVIDVNDKQKKEMIDYLDNLEKNGRIKFGMHTSKEALMTCYIQSKTNHVHFIDGGSGGYAMAAKSLKAK
ncbi:MAG: DUF3095 family protein [Bdellovibrio sp.]|nr:DUF3095 family protein [Bdellovibrio sp.]